MIGFGLLSGRLGRHGGRLGISDLCWSVLGLWTLAINLFLTYYRYRRHRICSLYVLSMLDYANHVSGDIVS